MRQRPSLSPPSLRAWTPIMESDYHGQCWIAWLLLKKGMQISEIHHHKVQNEVTRKCTVYRWLTNFSSGVETAAKVASMVRPATSHAAANVGAVMGLIMANRCITLNEMQEEREFPRGTLQAIAHDDLQMTKMCVSCTYKLQSSDIGPHWTQLCLTSWSTQLETNTKLFCGIACIFP